MGTAISVCRNVLDAAFMDEEELSSALSQQYGPQLLLRVDAAPIREAYLCRECGLSSRYVNFVCRRARMAPGRTAQEFMEIPSG